MNRFFYPRLAWDGLRKNRRLAWPYLLTCICMVAVFYIMGFLSSEGTLLLLPVGRSSAAIILTLGKWVILVFSVIFLYYTYSFLIRRRAREFGLYNVLGMGKRNLITFAAALAGGLLAGILLSKLAELGLMNLLNGTVNYAIRVDVDSVVLTAVCFAAIFMLITLSAVTKKGGFVFESVEAGRYRMETECLGFASDVRELVVNKAIDELVIVLQEQTLWISFLPKNHCLVFHLQTKIILTQRAIALLVLQKSLKAMLLHIMLQ